MKFDPQLVLVWPRWGGKAIVSNEQEGGNLSYWTLLQMVFYFDDQWTELHNANLSNE